MQQDYGSDTEVESWTTFAFTEQAVSAIQCLSTHFEAHDRFRDALIGMQEFQAPAFETLIQRRLAMYILCAANFDIGVSETIVVEYSTAIRYIHDFVNSCITCACSTFPNFESIEYMLSGFPVSVVAQTAGVSHDYAFYITESMRQFVIFRDRCAVRLPMAVANIMDNAVPLTGHAKSPLSTVELEAIYRYLDIRKPMYVHMLLQAAHEMSSYEQFLYAPSYTSDEIIQVVSSAWVFLLFLAANSNTLRMCESPVYDFDL